MSNRDIVFDRYDQEFQGFLKHVEQQKEVVPEDRLWLLSLPEEVREVVRKFPPNTIVRGSGGQVLWRDLDINGVVQAYGTVFSEIPMVGILPERSDRWGVLVHDRAAMVYAMPEDLEVVRHTGMWTPEAVAAMFDAEGKCEVCGAGGALPCRKCGLICERCHGLLVRAKKAGKGRGCGAPS